MPFIREWFFLLSHSVFDPSYGLFEYSNHGNYTLQINSASGINPDHLSYFKFIGRCLGLAIFHRRYVDAFFIPSLYKMMLRKPLSLSDLERSDEELHRSLKWMLSVLYAFLFLYLTIPYHVHSENDITDVLYETFTITEDRYGESVTADLKPGGSNIPVTESNKKEYVNSVVQYKIANCVEVQFDAMMEGLMELVPLDLLNVFDERELELLIGGMTEIDMYVSPAP
jgi:E3 ubiquitin-protein ligase NEDD4